MTTSKVTLRDYANSVEYPVLFWASTGCPTGDLTPLGYPDWSYPEAWDDAEGAVDNDGTWIWDGEGDLRDHRRNTVTHFRASDEQEDWKGLVSDYESECA